MTILNNVKATSVATLVLQMAQNLSRYLFISQKNRRIDSQDHKEEKASSSYRKVVSVKLYMD